MSLQAEPKPSQLIRDVFANRDGKLTIEDLINAFGSQGFGFIFIIMAMPLIIPLPPGIGFIPASLLCIWALQRALGGDHLWLPKAICRKEISPAIIEKIENKALPLYEKLENMFSGSQSVRLKESEIRLASLVVVLMSLLIMLPTPFLNSVPAVITILIGLTVLNSNRVFLWINMSFGLLTLGFIGSTLYMGLEILVTEVIKEF